MSIILIINSNIIVGTFIKKNNIFLLKFVVITEVIIYVFTSCSHHYAWIIPFCLGFKLVMAILIFFINPNRHKYQSFYRFSLSCISLQKSRNFVRNYKI